MLSLKTYLFITTVLILTFFVYFFENEVNEVNSQITRKSELIAKYKVDIKVLHAEWSFQNNPSRLENLAAKTVKVNKLLPNQVTNYTSIEDLNDRQILFSRKKAKHHTR
jgi:hypothetical protein